MNFESILESARTKNAKIAFIIIGIALLVYLALGSWVNKIHIAEKKVHNSVKILQENCDRRVQLIPQFVQLIQTYAPEANDILQLLQKAYQMALQNPISDMVLTDKAQSQAFFQTQKEITEAFSHMETKAQNYPALGQNRQYFMIKMQLQGLDQQIGFGVEALNKQVAYFNSLLLGFPQNLANSLFLHEKPKHPLSLATQPDNMGQF